MVVPDVEYVSTQINKGGQYYVKIDKCLYYANGSRKKGNLYLKCIAGRLGNCKVTGKLTAANKFSFGKICTHNHQDHEDEFQKLKIEYAAKKSASEHADTPLNHFEKAARG